MSDFVLQILQRVTFCLEHYELCQTFITKSCNLSSFDLKKLQSVRFELKILQRVRCWIKNFKICQIVIFKFHNVSVFESKILQRVTL